jgi:hypothetical protein
VRRQRRRSVVAHLALGIMPKWKTGYEKTSWVPALVRPPDPSAPLREWHSYRAELDVLDARLRASHPDFDWLEGLGRFKHQADAVIARRSRR